MNHKKYIMRDCNKHTIPFWGGRRQSKVSRHGAARPKVSRWAVGQLTPPPTSKGPSGSSVSSPIGFQGKALSWPKSVCVFNLAESIYLGSNSI